MAQESDNLRPGHGNINSLLSLIYKTMMLETINGSNENSVKTDKLSQDLQYI